MICKMIALHEIPITKACFSLEYNRRTYYNHRNQCNDLEKDRKINKEIHKIALEFPKYGYRRITKELQRREFTVNHKRVLKIMREENLLCRPKKRFKVITTNSNHNYLVYPNLTKDLVLTGINQLWVVDITYVHLLHECVYLAIIIDRFSRKCIGWNLSRRIDTNLALNALNGALDVRLQFGINGLIHPSDQGVQYASYEYVNRLNDFGIKISMSRKGNPYDNAFAESFMKTLKAEEVYLKEYANFAVAYSNIKTFIEEVYNKKRLHSSIGYMPPEEFEKEVLNTSINIR